MIFKVGDKVDWLGLKGEIDVIELALWPMPSHPIIVIFETGKTFRFTLDGRFADTPKPSLKLAEGKKDE